MIDKVKAKPYGKETVSHLKKMAEKVNPHLAKPVKKFLKRHKKLKDPRLKVAGSYGEGDDILYNMNIGLLEEASKLVKEAHREVVQDAQARRKRKDKKLDRRKRTIGKLIDELPEEGMRHEIAEWRSRLDFACTAEFGDPTIDKIRKGIDHVDKYFEDDLNRMIQDVADPKDPASMFHSAEEFLDRMNLHILERAERQVQEVSTTWV